MGDTARAVAGVLMLGCLVGCLVGCFVDKGGVPSGETGMTGSTGSTGMVTPTTGTGGPGTTGEPGTSTTSTTSITSTTGDTGSDSCEGFICAPTDGPAGCDVFLQDCPAGEKCSAYASSGTDQVDAAHCVPVTGDGAPGDPCLVEGGPVSGLDDCRAGARCSEVDSENKGICRELCGGSELAATCTMPGFTCSIDSSGLLNLCLPACNPLLQDCVGADLCVAVADGFVCVPDSSGVEGQAFDVCASAGACDKGLQCVVPKSALECDPDAQGCCVPYCDVTDAMFVCPGQQQICMPLFEGGMAPAGLENVGLCLLPQ